ncbi:MAG: hypothetical protein KGH54_00230 [Candidatus Micrarchaeota archaeon]|nr:hypothetical protein [Candidatus Micrarchaeota archaeon]
MNKISPRKNRNANKPLSAEQKAILFEAYEKDLSTTKAAERAGTSAVTAAKYFDVFKVRIKMGRDALEDSSKVDERLK